MKAYVDQDICIGCGLCVGIEPEVFFMNDDDKAEAKETLLSSQLDNVKEAVASCPVEAISIQGE